MTTELKVTEELFQQALKAYGSFEIARSNADRVSMRQGFELGMPYASHHQAAVATVERVAQFLHDEGRFAEAWSSSASRSASRRVGKECVSTGRSRWAPYHAHKKK